MVVWLAAAVLVFGLRPDLASMVAMAPIVVWLGEWGGSPRALVLRPRARGLPAGVRVVQHAVWLVPAAYALGAVLVAAPAEGPLHLRESIRGCLAISALIAVGPSTAAALFLRGSFLSAPGWRGAAVGAWPAAGRVHRRARALPRSGPSGTS